MEPNGLVLTGELPDISDITHWKTGLYIIQKTDWLIILFRLLPLIHMEDNVWFGTKGGVSVFDGTDWTSFTINDGLISNNILLILTDKNGIVYLGTDNGIMVYSDGQLVCYM